MRKLLWLLSGLLLAFVSSTVAQERPPEFPVRVDGQTVFSVREGIGGFTAEERAQAASGRLQKILESPTQSLNLRAEKTDGGWMIRFGTQPVIAVTDADARWEDTTAESLAHRWAGAIDQSLLRASNERSRQGLWRRVLITAMVLLGAFLAISLLRFGYRRLGRQMENQREKFPHLVFRGLEVLARDRLYAGARRLLLLAYFISALVLLLVALLLVFDQFPATRYYANEVARWIWEPLVRIGSGIVNYLPNLFYILVIVVVTRIVIRAIAFVFEQAHRGVISLEPWIHRDVARPTSQIIKFLFILVALFFIAPLVPGTGSTAAQGISVILGLMVSFGSTSTVGNIIAGMVLTYMRPFKLGDRVKIGEVVGDVIERTFLYTKLRTIKNEDVIVPSLQAIGGSLVNYSAEAQARGLILHTSVTIGYDAPWRKVHELLIRAAERTRDIQKEPRPFVLQTGLDDFFVSYQLNAYTDQPNRMADIYSELHQHIQDSFNEGGVEIMSPHYYQLRDGNTTTIPAHYRPGSYAPSRFLVDAASGQPRG